MWVLACTYGYAQETKNTNKVDLLESSKEKVILKEKEALKTEVESINKRVESGNISQSEAEELKKKSAEKRALNIENRVTIIDNKIALLIRNESEETDDEEGFVIQFGEPDDQKGFVYIGPNKKKRKYDRVTKCGLTFAIGLNHSLIDGVSLSDSPYSIGESRFIELGVAWNTRLLKNSNAVRIKYGFLFNGIRLM